MLKVLQLIVSSIRCAAFVIAIGFLIALSLLHLQEPQRSAASPNPWIIYRGAPLIYPTLASEGDGNIYAPDVHKEKSVWKMWYGGQDTSGHDRIHYATSSDGITWTKQGVVLDNLGYVNNSPILDNDPSVALINGTYYMYYSEYAGRCRINLATSSDGISWQRQGVVLDLTPHEWGTQWTCRPSILYEDKTFKLWYDSASSDGLLGVGYATSTDGIHFVKSRANPILRYSLGAVDVKHIGNQYIMAYQGTDRRIEWAASADETHFASQGQLISLTGGNQDAFGHVTPNIYLDEEGHWTRTYFGGASDSCWCKNKILMAFNDNYPIAGQKQVVIRGFKVVGNGNYPSFLADQPISFDGTPNDKSNPYFIYTTFYKGTAHTISVPQLQGYTIGYTICYDTNTCHTNPPIVGNSVTISADKPSTNGFVDLWWSYTLQTPGPIAVQP